MGMNTNDAKSFEEMAQEQEAPVTQSAPVESAPEAVNETPEVEPTADKTETPNAE